MHSSRPPTRAPPVLTPTLVLSLRVPLCDRQKDRLLACRSTVTSASSSPVRLATLVRSRIAPHVRTTMFGRRPSSNINSDLYQDHGGIIYGARGLNVNIALKRPCCFLDSELVSAATTSSSTALTIALVELCGIESIKTLEKFVEFRWRNLWQSMIYRSPVKSGWEFG